MTTRPYRPTAVPPPSGRIVRGLKWALFRPWARHRRLQPLWGRLHTLSLFGMNHGGGGDVASSGERWALEHVVRPRLEAAESPVVFDVGANVGQYTSLVAELLPRATVYAFEPAAAVFARLSRRCEAGGGRLRPFALAFSDTPGTSDLHAYTADGEEASVLASLDPRLPTQVVVVTERATEAVRLDTLDRFCAAEGVQRIHLLKLDVEGHELRVLRGAARMLAEGRIDLLQLEMGPASLYARTYFYDFWALLAGDYDLYRLLPAGIAPIPFYGEHREVFLTTNYLAIRRGAS